MLVKVEGPLSLPSVPHDNPIDLGNLEARVTFDSIPESL